MNDIIGRKLKDLPYVDGGAKGGETYIEKNGQPYRARAGEAGGLAVLGNDGKVPGDSLPAADPIRSDLASPENNKGAALVQYDADETVQQRLDALGNLRADLANEAPSYGPDLIKVAAGQTLRQWIAALAASAGSALVGFLQAGTGAVTRTVQGKLRDRVSVKDFGAVGNFTTNDSAAFTAAFAAADDVYVPPGNYNVSGLVIPANKRLYGAGKKVSVLRPTASAEFVVRLMSGAQIVNMGVNGNLVATHGVEIAGDYCKMIETHAQYCSVGFYNINKDVWTLEGTSTDNCTYSIYSAERGINCVISRHESRGSDTYGFYATYSVQQPQAIRFEHCLFFGNTYGIWFEKDTFFITIAKTIIDGCTNTGVRFNEAAPATAVDFFIEDCFIYADVIGVDIGAGCNHFVVRGGDVSNGSFANIRARATTTNRVTSLTIDGVNLGVCGGNSILLDSVDQAVVQNCYFTAPPTSNNIATQSTFTGTNPVVKVWGCKFSKVNAVSAFNTRVRNSVGQVNDNYGTAQMPSGSTSVVVNHGLSRAPTWVGVTLQGNLGNYWVSNFTATQFTLNIGTAAGVNVPFSWEARAD